MNGNAIKLKNMTAGINVQIAMRMETERLNMLYAGKPRDRARGVRNDRSRANDHRH